MKLILLFCFFGQILNAQTLEPGSWKAKSIFKVSGIPIPTDEEEQCISAGEAKDAKTTIGKELKKNGCSLLSWKVTGMTVQASLNCQNDQFDATGTLHGRFTTKSYDLSGEAEGTYQKVLPTTATLKLTGHWVGACKK